MFAPLFLPKTYLLSNHRRSCRALVKRWFWMTTRCTWHQSHKSEASRHYRDGPTVNPSLRRRKFVARPVSGGLIHKLLGSVGNSTPLKFNHIRREHSSPHEPGVAIPRENRHGGIHHTRMVFASISKVHVVRQNPVVEARQISMTRMQTLQTRARFNRRDLPWLGNSKIKELKCEF